MLIRRGLIASGADGKSTTVATDDQQFRPVFWVRSDAIYSCGLPEYKYVDLEDVDPLKKYVGHLEQRDALSSALEARADDGELHDSIDDNLLSLIADFGVGDPEIDWYKRMGFEYEGPTTSTRNPYFTGKRFTGSVQSILNACKKQGMSLVSMGAMGPIWPGPPPFYKTTNYARRIMEREKQTDWARRTILRPPTRSAPIISRRLPGYPGYRTPQGPPLPIHAEPPLLGHRRRRDSAGDDPRGDRKRRRLLPTFPPRS